MIFPAKIIWQDYNLKVKAIAGVAPKSAYKSKTYRNRFVPDKINRSIFQFDKSNSINNLPAFVSSIELSVCNLLKNSNGTEIFNQKILVPLCSRKETFHSFLFFFFLAIQFISKYESNFWSRNVAVSQSIRHDMNRQRHVLQRDEEHFNMLFVKNSRRSEIKNNRQYVSEFLFPELYRLTFSVEIM